MEFNSTIGYLDKLKLFFVLIPSEILNKTAEPEDKSRTNQRFVVTLNKVESWSGGSVSLEGGDAYITVSKARLNKLNLHLNSNVHVHLEKDNSEFGMPVPEEFIEIIKQDQEAYRRFYALTKGKQRAIIYIVIQLKTSEKRIEKSLFLLENLKKSPEKNTTMRHILGKE